MDENKFHLMTLTTSFGLGVDQDDARLVMIYDGRWKYVHAEGFSPLLYDLLSDPDELTDLAANPLCAEHLERLAGYHFQWSRQHHTRITRTAEQVDAMAEAREPPGVFIAYWDKKELEDDGLTMPTHASS